MNRYTAYRRYRNKDGLVHVAWWTKAVVHGRLMLCEPNDDAIDGTHIGLSEAIPTCLACVERWEPLQGGWRP